MAAHGSKLWDEKPIAGARATTGASSAIQQITIKELYVFVWKVAIASFLFAVPFLVIWFLATLK